MHALCTIVSRNLMGIQNALEYYHENAWDYAMIGGRYSNIIPVGKKCKLINSGGWPDMPGHNFPYTDRAEAHPDRNYTNIARIRNIDQNECFRIRQFGGLSPWEPYTMILCHDDGGFEWIDWETLSDEAATLYRNFLLDIRRQSWYMAVVDYHY